MYPSTHHAREHLRNLDPLQRHAAFCPGPEFISCPIQHVSCLPEHTHFRVRGCSHSQNKKTVHRCRLLMPVIRLGRTRLPLTCHRGIVYVYAFCQLQCHRASQLKSLLRCPLPAMLSPREVQQSQAAMPFLPTSMDTTTRIKERARTTF